MYKFISSKSSSGSNDIIEKLATLEIKVYTMSGCRYCTLLKQMLKPYKDSITFIESRNEAIQAGVKSFPTSISKDGVRVVGYYETIQEYLAQF